jgi:hypothetical protein
MATYYVDSAAAGTGTGADWTNAYTTIGAATTSKAAGDVFYIASTHAESAAAAVSITVAGTLASPQNFYSVDKTAGASPTAITAGASIAATGGTTANTFNITSGYANFYGITLACGSGASGATNFFVGTSNALSRFYFKDCKLRALSAITGTRIRVGLSTSSLVTLAIFDNTQLEFAHSGAGIQVDNINMVEWRNTPTGLLGTAIATVLGPVIGHITIDSVDLSGATALGSPAPTNISKTVLKDCKLPATLSLGNPGLRGSSTTLLRCDTGAGVYRNEHWLYEGALTTETTFVKTGGAQNNGTPYSWKIVTSANSKWATPFIAIPLAVPNSTVGTSITLTLDGLWSSAGSVRPNNDDIWIDATYEGTSGSTAASLATSNKSGPLAANAVLATSAASWGGALTNATPFKMTVTLTPQIAGLVYVIVKAAKVSSTFYIDPLVTVS